MDDDEKEQTEMVQQFKRMSKVLLAHQAEKMLAVRVEMNLKPEHRHQFDDLMRDIGIVNETVMDNLWAHVELTVEKDKMSDDEAESMNHKMKKVEAENQSLRVQLAAVSEKMKAIQAIIN